jgi:hypothetical protein
LLTSSTTRSTCSLSQSCFRTTFMSTKSSLGRQRNPNSSLFQSFSKFSPSSFSL